MRTKFTRFSLIVITILCVNAFAQAQITGRNFNERFVLGALTQLINAEVTYASVAGNGNFGTLAELHDAGLIDPALASGHKYGYSFTLNLTLIGGTEPAAFQISAKPAVFRKTGIRSFYADTSGIVRGADHGGLPADPTDPEIDTCVIWGNSDNERCTLIDMSLLHGAQMTYSSTFGNGNYTSLHELSKIGLIHQRLGSGQTRGYQYTVTVAPSTDSQPATFRVSAVPQIYGITGTRSFFIDRSGVLRGADRNGGPADETDPPIEF